MNEELQKQLIAAIQEIRAGSTELFQTLSNQISNYNLTIAISCLIAFCLVSSLSLKLGYLLKETNTLSDDSKIVCSVVILMGIVASIVSAAYSIQGFAKYFAPFGDIL